MSIFFISKKSSELHLCVDYQDLNIITIKNQYSLFLISELLDCLDDSTVFSKIDLKNIYHCIQIHEEDEWKTVFQTQYDHYEYLVVFFSLINTSVTFQVYINRVLQGLVDDFCVIYLDDILIFFKSEEEHQKHLELVIECLQQAELYTNSKKCEFFKLKLEYLEFIINSKNLQMNSAHVQTISEWHNHLFKIYQDIQIFIRFCNFYWHFIYNFFSIVQFLYQLLHSMKNDEKSEFIADNWQKFQQEVFEQLINAFISASVLCHYNSDCKLHMKINASVYADILS